MLSGGVMVLIAREIREGGMVVGQVIKTCVSFRLVCAGEVIVSERKSLGDEVFWLYLTRVSEESRRRRPSLKRVRERKLSGESFDVGCGVGSWLREKSKESDVRGREIGDAMCSFVQMDESLVCKVLWVSAGLEVRDRRLDFIGWMTKHGLGEETINAKRLDP